MIDICAYGYIAKEPINRSDCFARRRNPLFYSKFSGLAWNTSPYQQLSF
jgi:hypothetical protein